MGVPSALVGMTKGIARDDKSVEMTPFRLGSSVTGTLSAGRELWIFCSERATGNWETLRHWTSILDTAAADGFHAVEIPSWDAAKADAAFTRKLSSLNLGLIVQIHTEGRTVDEHIESLNRLYNRAIESKPVFVNAHPGSDVWDIEGGLRFFEAALKLEERVGVPLTHETHRLRFLFTGPNTLAVTRAFPTIKLTADISHWFCVHESDCRNQPDAVDALIERAFYLHDRVGHSEGPQVPDPSAPAWKSWLDRSTDVWQRIVDLRHTEGTRQFYITPEFGPPAYMWTDPKSGRPLADTWQVNVWMRDYLIDNLK